MSISVGDRLPEGKFQIMTAEGPKDISTNEIFPGKKVALFAVPGAFTPTCHLNHLPGYLRHLDAFKEKGVDIVACTAVNDVFVMNAWAESSGAKDKILFLADGNGNFARALGLDLDASGAGLGQRSKRYAMLVEDGVVKALHVEDAPGQVTSSGAETLLREL